MGSREVGTSSGIFWASVEHAQGKMAAAVEAVRSWVVEGAGLTRPFGQYNMDTLNTLLIGWLFFALLGLLLCKFLFDKYVKISSSEEPDQEFIYEEQLTDDVFKEEVSRKPTIVPDECPAADIASTPIGTGADPDAVRWANNVFTWLYNGSEAAPVFTNTWLQALNDFTNRSALEVSAALQSIFSIFALTLKLPYIRNQVLILYY